METQLVTPPSSSMCSPFGRILLDSGEQTSFDRPLPYDGNNRTDVFRVVCAAQSALNGISSEEGAERPVLKELLRRAVAQCDSVLRERIDNNEGLDNIHYIYILVRNIRKLYWSKEGKLWQLCSLEAGKTKVRMAFVLGKDCEQGTERDYLVQHLDLPMGHLQLFVPSLRFRREDGGVCDLVHLFDLEAFNSYIQLQPEELEDIECIQINDFFE
jgi:hypothetical protein